MSYKVEYYTLAIMDDSGKLGNIKQSTGHVFTDEKIEEIPKKLNEFLAKDKRTGVITEIKDVGGKCL